MNSIACHNSAAFAVNKKSLKKLLRIITRGKSNLSSDEEYQFIQRSTVPTLHFQKSLPRLPIPKLEDTCSRYLLALKPLLTNDQFEKTEHIVRKFQNDGISLNTELQTIDSKNKHTSYISEPWFHMYLSDRTPIPINYNPAMIFINDKNEPYNNQLIRATNLIISSLRFYKSLKNNVLEPEVFHLYPKKSDTDLFRNVTKFLPESISWYGAYLFNAYPLDMSQYSSLFCSTRIPEVGKDRLFKDENKRHITVLKDGSFYIFDVLDENGNILDATSILSNISYILNDSSSKTEFPIGVLTTESRDDWANVRKHLEHVGNSNALSLIDNSLFAVSLDSDGSDEPVKIIKQFLHSDGCNRWFDKSFTLIIAKNGVAGLNFEHSWGDGVAVLRYFQDIFKDSTTKPRVHPDSPVSFDAKPKKLEFILDDQIKSKIQNATKKYKETCDLLNVDYLEFPEIHKKFCKTYQVSPDALMQLSFQLAYQKLYKKQVTTYESCSTAAFKLGRTEAIRPCTLETQKFCLTVDDDSKKATNEELLALIKQCSDKHSLLTKNAAMGQGFDRHLFVLRKIAEKRGSSIPEIYTDSSYSLINYNILSTSTLSSDVILGGGFGPVVKDGFGIAYMIKTDNCGAVITNYNKFTDGSGFKIKLQESLKDIYSILRASK